VLEQAIDENIRALAEKEPGTVKALCALEEELISKDEDFKREKKILKVQYEAECARIFKTSKKVEEVSDKLKGVEKAREALRWRKAGLQPKDNVDKYVSFKFCAFCMM
jgi:hypothetical protein